jgi:hypothetical protein
LEQHDIPVPPYAVLDRTNDPDADVTEREDAIEINGRVVSKPFVMKPVDAENHNVSNSCCLINVAKNALLRV